MPRLAEIHRTYRDRGLALIGVSLDRSREPVERMVAERDLDWPQVWDAPGGGGGPLAQRFHVEGAPALYVLDAEGRIAGKRLRLEELEDLVDGLLQEESPGEAGGAP